MGAWVLYYLAWTAHILVGGFALFRGRLPEQLTILTIALAIIIEQVVLVSQWSPEPISYLWLEISTNLLQCVGFLLLIFIFKRASWLVIALFTKCTELAINGLVLQDNTRLSHVYLPQVSDALSILMMAILAWAMGQRERNHPDSSQTLPLDHQVQG